MTDRYLWDGSGAVDPEVLSLEETLGAVRYRHVPLAVPPVRAQEMPRTAANGPRYGWPEILFAFVAALALAIGVMALLRTENDPAPGDVHHPPAVPRLEAPVAAPPQPAKEDPEARILVEPDRSTTAETATAETAASETEAAEPSEPAPAKAPEAVPPAKKKKKSTLDGPSLKDPFGSGRKRPRLNSPDLKDPMKGGKGGREPAPKDPFGGKKKQGGKLRSPDLTDPFNRN